jgi:hypothetical protein
VHLSAEGLHRHAVAQLVQSLEERKQQDEHKDALGSEHPVQEVVGQIVPMHGRQHDTHPHPQQPQHGSRRRE